HRHRRPSGTARRVDDSRPAGRRLLASRRRAGRARKGDAAETRGRDVKATSILLTVVITVTLQLMLARYMVGGKWLFDLVLVGVVYCALNWGPAAGMLAGTCGGLIQDVLSDDIVGIGGLSKTIVGFLTGALGAQ